MFETMNKNLEQKKYFAGENLSISDFAIFSYLVYPYKFSFNQEFRKKFEYVAKWFERIADLKCSIKYFGKNRYSAKPWF